MRKEYHARVPARAALPTGLMLLMFAALGLLLAACAGGSGSAAHEATSTPNGGAGNQTPSTTPQTPVTISTPGAPQGIAGLCALPVSVSTQPPGDIPPYPSAQLHIASNQNGSGLFGYCSTASVAEVNSFYTAKIPESGWQHISASSIGATDQIMATKGSTTLIITILADSQVDGDTDIVIVTSASGS